MVGGRSPVVVNTSWIDCVMRSCCKQTARTLRLLRLEELANRLRLVLSTLCLLLQSFGFLWPFGVMVSELFPCHAMNSSTMLDLVKPPARKYFVGAFPNAFVVKQSARLGAL